MPLATPYHSPLKSANRWLLALVMLAPVVAVYGLLPTFFADTAEAILWGRMLPLWGSHKHPPLMGWVASLVEMVSTAEAWKALALQLALNGLAIFYCDRIAKLLMPPERRYWVVVGLCFSLVMTLWTAVGFSLNADMVAMPLWPGSVYHLMMAQRKPGRWFHWAMLGLLGALCILTKYFGAILPLSLMLASLFVPAYRRMWRHAGPYVAILVALLVLSPHIYWLTEHFGTAHYAGQQFHRDGAYGARLLLSLGRFIFSFIMLGIPFLSLCTVLYWLRGRQLGFDWSAFRANPHRAFLAAFFLIFCLICFVAIALGINYLVRFNAPLYGIFVLVWFCAIPFERFFDARDYRFLTWLSFGIWSAVYAGMVVLYWQMSTHALMQRPLPAIAAVLRADWAAQHACGPAYIVGDWSATPGLAVYYDRKVIGVPLIEAKATPWFTPERLKAGGAIYFFREDDPTFHQVVPHGLQVRHIARPTRVTRKPQDARYVYAFQPPAGCS